MVDLFVNLLNLERIKSYTLSESVRAFLGRTNGREDNLPLSGQGLSMAAHIERDPGKRPATCLPWCLAGECVCPVLAAVIL